MPLSVGKDWDQEALTAQNLDQVGYRNPSCCVSSKCRSDLWYYSTVVVGEL